MPKRIHLRASPNCRGVLIPLAYGCSKMRIDDVKEWCALDSVALQYRREHLIKPADVTPVTRQRYAGAALRSL